MTLVFAIIVFAVVLDQVTKLLLYGKELTLIPGVVGILSPDGLNTGMAWGLLGGKTGSVIFLSCVTVLTLAVLIYLLVHYRKQMPRLLQVALAMVTGGAVGNLIDRIFLGGVRDFIHTEFIDFPIFNAADIFVTCGGILLAVTLIFTRSGRGFAAEFFKDDKPSGKKAGKERN